MTDAPMTDLTWTDQAACKGQDVDQFYESESGGKQAAALFCAHCPVLDSCFAMWRGLPHYAQRWGVWWGTTPIQRQKMRRTRHGVRPR